MHTRAHKHCKVKAHNQTYIISDDHTSIVAICARSFSDNPRPLDIFLFSLPGRSVAMEGASGVARECVGRLLLREEGGGGGEEFSRFLLGLSLAFKDKSVIMTRYIVCICVGTHTIVSPRATP